MGVFREVGKIVVGGRTGDTVPAGLADFLVNSDITTICHSLLQHFDKVTMAEFQVWFFISVVPHVDLSGYVIFLTLRKIPICHKFSQAEYWNWVAISAIGDLFWQD